MSANEVLDLACLTRKSSLLSLIYLNIIFRSVLVLDEQNQPVAGAAVDANWMDPRDKTLLVSGS